jgi:L-threonylcarbamoyladenylate synthase
LDLAYAFTVNQNPEDLMAALSAAAAHLIKGGLVAFPTETVYGLGANAEDRDAVAGIYRVKNRPSDHPLIVHIAHPSDVEHFATEVPEYAKKLMADFWPGPMTLILKRTDNSKDFITGNQDTVGLRIPNHPIALALLVAFKSVGGIGLAAPSANRYGSVSPTEASAVEIELGSHLDAKDMILDGGQSEVGLESTIIDCTGPAPKILRPGAISAQMIEGSTSMVVAEPGQERIRVSGSHTQHYSPKAKVFIGGSAKPGEGLIAGSEHPTPEGAIRLAAPKSVEDYAASLYAALRQADSRSLETVRVLLPEGDGLALAIRDRVQRAAAKE